VPGSDDNLLSVKLSGRDIPETLAAMDLAWHSAGTVDPITGSVEPISRTFVDAYIADLQAEVLRQAEAFLAFAGIAMFLGCLGVFGLSLSTTKRRIKEIGVRKAMGAGDAQIVLLLLWQFAGPVLWANLIAWPVAWWLMRRWLSGFAYHIDLQWWVFAGASLGALLIALLTVAGQAWLAARQKPVLALRYE
jgi:putative ABC transport system permease protein